MYLQRSRAVSDEASLSKYARFKYLSGSVHFCVVTEVNKERRALVDSCKYLTLIRCLNWWNSLKSYDYSRPRLICPVTFVVDSISSVKIYCFDQQVG